MFKKLIGPVIFTLILVTISIAYCLFLLNVFTLGFKQISGVASIIILIILGVLLFGAIYNLVERIKEIKRGDEDDLSKY